MIRTLPVIGLTLWRRRQLLTHDRWPRERLLAHQDRAIASLRAYAYERSPFYRRFHAGYETRPHNELPVLSKAQMLEEFDTRRASR